MLPRTTRREREREREREKTIIHETPNPTPAAAWTTDQAVLVTMALAAAALQTIPGPTRKVPPTTTTALETPATVAATAPAVPSAVYSGSSLETDKEEIEKSVSTTAMTPAGCHNKKQ